eukprot:305859_1
MQDDMDIEAQRLNVLRKYQKTYPMEQKRLQFDETNMNHQIHIVQQQQQHKTQNKQKSHNEKHTENKSESKRENSINESENVNTSTSNSNKHTKYMHHIKKILHIYGIELISKTANNIQISCSIFGDKQISMIINDTNSTTFTISQKYDKAISLSNYNISITSLETT